MSTSVKGSARNEKCIPMAFVYHNHTGRVYIRQNCIDHDSYLGKYATGIFWASVSCMAIGLVASVLIYTVALVRKSCGGSSGSGSHMSMV